MLIKKSNSIFSVFILVILLSIVVYFFNKFLPSSVKDAQSGDYITKSQAQELIKETIMNNPELIISSVENMQRRKFEEEQRKSSDYLKNHKEKLISSEVSPFIGNKDSDVTIIEFFDYNCGYCKKSSTIAGELIQKDKNIKIIFKEFPIFGESSNLASSYALAVYLIDPSKYYEVHKKFMQLPHLDKASIQNTIKELGLNLSKIEETLHDNRINKEIEEVRKLAIDLNVNGTPAFVIGEELIPGAVPLNLLLDKVKEYRKK